MSLQKTTSEKTIDAIAKLSKRLKDVEAVDNLNFGTITLIMNVAFQVDSGVLTYLPWTAEIASGSNFTWNDVPGERHKIHTNMSRTSARALIAGITTWDSDRSTLGIRYMNVNFFSSAGVPLTGALLYSFDATDGGDMTVPFVYPLGCPDQDGYFAFAIYQDSGFIIDFNYAFIGAFAIR